MKSASLCPASDCLTGAGSRAGVRRTIVSDRCSTASCNANNVIPAPERLNIDVRLTIFKLQGTSITYSREQRGSESDLPKALCDYSNVHLPMQNPISTTPPTPHSSKDLISSESSIRHSNTSLSIQHTRQ